MHKERIIDGIEKVFEGYAKDEELRGAMRENDYTFRLFSTHGREETYFFNNDCEIYKYIGLPYLGYMGICPPRQVAESYFDYFRFRCKPPITLTKARAMLKEDLGERVEKLKKDYVRKYD